MAKASGACEARSKIEDPRSRTPTWASRRWPPSRSPGASAAKLRAATSSTSSAPGATVVGIDALRGPTPGITCITTEVLGRQ